MKRTEDFEEIPGNLIFEAIRISGEKGFIVSTEPIFTSVTSKTFVGFVPNGKRNVTPLLLEGFKDHHLLICQLNKAFEPDEGIAPAPKSQPKGERLKNITYRAMATGTLKEPKKTGSRTMSSPAWTF